MYKMILSLVFVACMFGAGTAHADPVSELNEVNSLKPLYRVRYTRYFRAYETSTFKVIPTGDEILKCEVRDMYDHVVAEDTTFQGIPCDITFTVDEGPYPTKYRLFVFNTEDKPVKFRVKVF